MDPRDTVLDLTVIYLDNYFSLPFAQISKHDNIRAIYVLISWNNIDLLGNYQSIF